MIKRHGNTDPVGGRQTDLFADEKSVVENVAMGKRRAFRETRRAAGELDVDGIGGLQAFADGR